MTPVSATGVPNAGTDPAPWREEALVKFNQMGAQIGEAAADPDQDIGQPWKFGS